MSLTESKVKLRATCKKLETGLNWTGRWERNKFGVQKKNSLGTKIKYRTSRSISLDLMSRLAATLFCCVLLSHIKALNLIICMLFNPRLAFFVTYSQTRVIFQAHIRTVTRRAYISPAIALMSVRVKNAGTQWTKGLFMLSMIY